MEAVEALGKIKETALKSLQLYADSKNVDFKTVIGFIYEIADEPVNSSVSTTAFKNGDQIPAYGNEKTASQVIIGLQNKNAMLLDALRPFGNLADEVFKEGRYNRNGVLYAFNKAEITFEALRAANEAIQEKE